MEIKVQAPRAVDATLSPRLRLRDGVEFPRHRRDVVPITGVAVHEGLHNNSHTQVGHALQPGEPPARARRGLRPPRARVPIRVGHAAEAALHLREQVRPRPLGDSPAPHRAEINTRRDTIAPITLKFGFRAGATRPASSRATSR